MPIIVCITGKSNSGKTMLIEKIIPNLKSRGLYVSVIKHTHKTFEMDFKGKDTWRYSTAGADESGILSEKRFAVIKESEKPIKVEDIIKNISADVILLEGFSATHYPKIFVTGQDKNIEFKKQGSNTIAIYGDVTLPVNIPVFSENQISELVDFILKK